MSAKRFLVTGAAGFVGSVLVRRLVAEGHDVHVLLKPSSNVWRIRELLPSLQVHHVDLSDEAALKALAVKVKPEVIYHLAAHGAYPFQSDPDGIIATNFLGTWNLAKATAAIDYEVFVNTGSSSEYGFKDFAMRETDLLEPNSYYSVAKCAQTLLCQHFAHVEKRPITTFRLFSAYGPYEEPTRLVPTVISRSLRGESLKLVSPDIARDFVYVEDVVEAYLSIEKLSKLSGEIVNIGTGVQHTVKDVVDSVLKHTGSKVACEWGGMAQRVWDARTWVADATKSMRLLGWRPRVTLDDGLARTVSWARETAHELA